MHVSPIPALGLKVGDAQTYVLPAAQSPGLMGSKTVQRPTLSVSYVAG